MAPAQHKLSPTDTVIQVSEVATASGVSVPSGLYCFYIFFIFQSPCLLLETLFMTFTGRAFINRIASVAPGDVMTFLNVGMSTGTCLMGCH